MPDSYDEFVKAWNQDALDIHGTTFKRLFLTDDGQYVLGEILERCKFLDACENERDMALNNFAKELMYMIYYDRQKKELNIHTLIAFVRNKLKRRPNA